MQSFHAENQMNSIANDNSWNKITLNFIFFICFVENRIHLTTEFYLWFQRLEKPVLAPLQKLHFSNCRLSSVPDLGILPHLVELNISFNPLDQISPQQFSQYCSLTKVALESSTEMSPCMCKTLKAYLERREIALIDWLDCPTIHEGNKMIKIIWSAELIKLISFPKFSFILLTISSWFLSFHRKCILHRILEYNRYTRLWKLYGNSGRKTSPWKIEKNLALDYVQSWHVFCCIYL